jgi:hypothetical protein
MKEIILLKSYASSLDNNNTSHAERPDQTNTLRISGIISDINTNGTLVFKTNVGDMVIANPGNLKIGDSITIEVGKNDLAAVGKLVSVNNIDSRTASIIQEKQSTEIQDTVNTSHKNFSPTTLNESISKSISTRAEQQNVLSRLVSNLPIILEVTKRIKKDSGEYFSNALEALSHISFDSTKTASWNFLGLLNVVIDDEDKENEEPAKFNLKSIAEDIKTLREILGPQAILKNESWSVIPFYFNNKNIEDDFVKCYVKKHNNNIMRFILDVSALEIQFDGMLKMTVDNLRVEEFDLIVHFPRNDSELVGHINQIFQSNLEKYSLKGKIKFEKTLISQPMQDQTFTGIIV